LQALGGTAKSGTPVFGGQGRGWGLRSPKNLHIVRHMYSRQHGQPGLFLVSNLLTGLLLRPARI
jgi:hypothetical protein